MLRLDDETLKIVDNWRATHEAGPLTRPEAIRKLIKVGLGTFQGDVAL